MVRKNPCELQIDLFCNGIEIDPSCVLEREGRLVSRTRAGLGSGLEMVIAGAPPLNREVWVNVPVEEDFVAKTPFLLKRRDGYEVVDRRDGEAYPVRIPAEPAWYSRKTAKGTEMRRIGVLQGTYLGIYVSNSCMYWYDGLQCRFCTTGWNVGVNEAANKDVEEVVETALAAKQESGITFVHFNTGYQRGKALQQLAPYVEAIKRRVGALVGVQAVPEAPMAEYDRLIAAGCDHFSFCYEYQDPEWFARICPGKAETVGQQAYFDALAYCQKRLPKGACSGEIIAGNEPIGKTLEAIDWITSIGAFPTVCIFRPLIGSGMEDWPSPDYETMRRVMKHLWEACRDRGIPIGMAPNIEVSLIVQPTDTAYLADMTWRDRWYLFKLGLMKRVAGPIFRRRMHVRT